MIVLNFSHPLTGVQLGQLRALLEGVTIGEVIDLRCQVAHDLSFGEQASKQVLALSKPTEWWSRGNYVVVPPALAPYSLSVCACIHALSGHFPSIVRLAPAKVAAGAPPAFDVAEIVGLQALRDALRATR